MPNTPVRKLCNANSKKKLERKQLQQNIDRTYEENKIQLVKMLPKIKTKITQLFDQ